MPTSASMRFEKRFVEHPLVRPNRVENRLYQRRILERAKESNILIVLPTALGKTVIAALLIVHRLFELGGKAVFLAPTRPLVTQHYERFKELLELDLDDMVVLTGQVPQLKRKELFKRAKMVFATPQVIKNDLAEGTIDLREVVTLVFDEAHRARGSYAYVEIAKRYMVEAEDPRILALTASPGGKEEFIKQVCRNLSINAIEVRTDEDEDVAPYIQLIETRWRKVKLPQEYEKVRVCIKEMLKERVTNLQSLGCLVGKDVKKVSKGDLIKLNEELQKRLEQGEGGYLYHIKAQATASISIAHALELLETQGIDTLKAFIEDTLNKGAEEGGRAYKSILVDPLFAEASFYLKQAEGVKHPKYQVLCEVVEKQLKDKPDSRIILFTQYRETAKNIIDFLSQVPGVRASRFVGQASRGRNEGMSQKHQQEVLASLRSGGCNVLVATSIAEEGLDIPEVDHVIFYEPVPSEIRYIQRRGRTGRRVAGRVTILMTEDSMDEAFYWASVHRVRKMKAILKRLDMVLSKEVVKEGKLRRVREATLSQYMEPTETSKKLSSKVGWFTPSLPYARGMSKAVRWLEEHLSEEPVKVERVMEEAQAQGIEKSSIEAALGRLLQLGLIYQPQPGVIRYVKKHV